METIWITAKPYEPDFGSGPYEAAGAGGGASGCTFDSQEGCYEGGGGGGGSTASTTTNTPVEPFSCPTQDPNCLKPLDDLRTKVKSAIELITGSDTACKRSVVKLREVFAADHIYRGNPDISD